MRLAEFNGEASEASSPFGAVLRALRDRHRVSQLELAAQAGSTPRYISFIETGRSRPGRELVERIADALDATARDRAQLLRAAGLAASVSEHRLTDAELDAHRIAIERRPDTLRPRNRESSPRAGPGLRKPVALQPVLCDSLG